MQERQTQPGTGGRFPKMKILDGGPDTIRTCDLALRRGALYPTELRGQRVDFCTEPSLVQHPIRILPHPRASAQCASPHCASACSSTSWLRPTDHATIPGAASDRHPASPSRKHAERSACASACSSTTELRGQRVDFCTEPSLVQHPIGILPHPRSKRAMRFNALRKRLQLDQLSYGACCAIIAGTMPPANSCWRTP